MKAHQPDLFQPDFNLVPTTGPDPDAWSVAAEAARRDALRAETARQTTLFSDAQARPPAQHPPGRLA